MKVAIVGLCEPIVNLITLGHGSLLRSIRNSSITTNWNEMMHSHAPVIKISNKKELITAITDHQDITVAGSGHNFNSIWTWGRVILDLSSWSKMKLRDTILTVTGGVKIKDIQTYLSRYHRSLPIAPSYVQQQFIGALATNTHSTGWKSMGYIADYVDEIKFIDGSGNDHHTKRGDNNFGAIIGSLSFLGVIYGVKLQTVPLYYMRKTLTRVPWNDIKCNIGSYLDHYDHIRILQHQNSHFHAIMITWELTDDIPSFYDKVKEIGSTYFHTLLWFLVYNLVPDWISIYINKGVSYILPQVSYVKSSTDCWCDLYYGPHIEMCAAFPMEKWNIITDQLFDIIDTTSNLSTITEIRFTRSDATSLLGPTFTNNSSGVVFWCNMNPLQIDSAYSFLNAVKDMYIHQSGIFHLGKYFDVLSTTKHRWQWEQFSHYQKHFDPDNKFGFRQLIEELLN